MSRASIHGFDQQWIETENGRLYAEVGGDGPVVALLHGFPETSAMWRDVAPLLASECRVVCFDLPGYGRSDAPSNGAMSKREIATTIHQALGSLGAPSYALVGHDRGGRVAYRAALDRPEAVRSLAVLDVIPTAEVWDRADDRMALAFWPFSLLAQPEPLPERLLTADPDAFVDAALENWGTPASVFPPEIRAAYVDSLRASGHAHAICQEYRAAAGVDRELDNRDRSGGRRIRSPLLGLWSASGGLNEWYREAGGPLGIWSDWADDVSGEPVDGGHFFPEERPRQTAQLLLAFHDRHRP